MLPTQTMQYYYLRKSLKVTDHPPINPAKRQRFSQNAAKTSWDFLGKMVKLVNPAGCKGFNVVLWNKISLLPAIFRLMGILTQSTIFLLAFPLQLPSLKLR